MKEFSFEKFSIGKLSLGEPSLENLSSEKPCLEISSLYLEFLYLESTACPVFRSYSSFLVSIFWICFLHESIFRLMHSGLNLSTQHSGTLTLPSRILESNS